MKILIVEDDRSLCNSINDYLRMEGHICEMAQDYSQGILKTADNRYDCIILDIGLPDGNGLNIIRELKANKMADGILILSAKSSLDDKLLGLKIGADDYLTKPFHFAELSARINSIYRRNNLSGMNEIGFNEIRVNTSDKQAYVNNTLLNLTRKEYEILLYFVVNHNKVITRESIAEHIWGDNISYADNFDFIYSHIKNLRKKIELNNGRNYLHSMYGIGYKFSDK